MEGVIADNLAIVRSRIEAAARAAGRPAQSVTLVAVSKTHPAATVRQALAAGHRVFGENRVQEAEAKYPTLREAFPDLALHLIGPLQTNKVRDAVAIFDVIETVDRPRLAQALAKEIDRSGRRPPCLIEVNTGEEAQKAGILPVDADGFIVECRDRLGLPIQGLMCIPPIDEEPARHFVLLREIARRNGLGLLSMGMSADFEKAIRFGATHVRVGTAIFGARGAEHSQWAKRAGAENVGGWLHLPVVGLDEESLVRALRAYKSGERQSQIIHAVALSLSNEEIAIVAHLATLQKEAKQP